MPDNITTGRKNPYPGISSVLLGIGEKAKRDGVKALEKETSLLIRDGKIYVEFVHGDVTDLDKGIDAVMLNRRLGVKINNVYKNRASAWVELNRLIPLARQMPAGYLMEEVYIHDEDDQGPVLINSATYLANTSGGRGIRIAILEQNYIGLTTARIMGQAPTLANSQLINMTGDLFEAPGTAHGTHSVQTVFDHAPEAEYFIIKIGGLADMGAAVQICIDNGVHIISHSLSRYNTGWGDNTGVACAAVQDASDNGILFFTSAGNRNGTHWQGNFSDPNNNQWHNWNGNNERNSFTVSGHPDTLGRIQLHLQWSGPSTVNHYDLYLYDAENVTLLDLSTNTNGFETINFTTDIDREVFFRVRRNNIPGVPPPAFEVFNHGRRCTDFSQSSTRGSTTSPSNSTAANLISVGAVPRHRYESDSGTDGIIAGYSSRGPTNGGRIRPHLCAPTNTRVVTPTGAIGSYGGTSCATPNAAGAAAAFWSGHPQLNAEGVRRILFAKAGIYKDWGASGNDNIYGRGGLYLYDYHRNNRYILDAATNTAVVPRLPYISMWQMESAANVASNLRGIHLDPVDNIPLSGAVFNKPMLYRAARPTTIRPGANALMFQEDDDMAMETIEDFAYFYDDAELDASFFKEPAEITLDQGLHIFPNPMQSSATIEYRLERPAKVLVNIMDINGKLVHQLVNANQDAGVQRITFDRGELPSGVYLCQLHTDHVHHATRIVIGR